MRRCLHYFTKTERLLWGGSVFIICASFFLFGGTDYLSLTASLVGATALIFCARGNPVGQVLVIIFSLLYGYISYTFTYYGEMLTYLGMTMPLATVALISWLRHPFAGNHAEVEISRLTAKQVLVGAAASLGVTYVFYFLLRDLGTANLIPSTVSITTSFFAAYLTLLRSPWYAVAYATNDVVLIVLWTLAAMSDWSYLPVLVCFMIFFVNDIYGFWSWRAMQRRQESGALH
ncbi:MAG: nicotinamide mononucleotide transporter [Oscillospiraceae bacterium]|nr:nicotinamide mononucleotide transporter [Oscillospiraceae bacterium]